MAKSIEPFLPSIAEVLKLRFGVWVRDILAIIDAALERKGLSAAAASRLAVGNPSLIKNMRTGSGDTKRFNAFALQRLAEVLELEFYFGEPREATTVALPAGFSERTIEPLATARARQEALEMGFLPIPYHRAAAPDFRGTAPVALARQWLNASDLAPETLSFLPVVNDDMAPTLSVGALALVDTGRTALPAVAHDEAGLWALATKGRYVFARAQRPDADMMILTFDRPDRPMQIFKGEDLRTLTVLGQVVWVAQRA